MAELGARGNVMGPQPIGRRSAVPSTMIAAAEEFLKLMVAGEKEAVAALAMPASAHQVAEFAATVPQGTCDWYEIIATARVNQHYYVKARLTGARPLTLQFRLGEYQARWMVWELMDLTGRRGAWAR